MKDLEKNVRYVKKEVIEMVLIPIYMCPACGGEVLYDAQFDEWRCKECHRVWGKGVKKPVFELG